MDSTNKVFEEWEQVDCNTCQHYWDSSCDSVGAFKKPCNSYVATRRIDIPRRIELLDEQVKKLTWFDILIGVSFIIHVVMHLG
jgi:hypothetical protein